MRGAEQIPWLYDPGMALLERLGLHRWRRWLVRGAAGRVLDLGTGTGRDLPLLPEGVRAVALDPHPWNLRHARRRGPSALLVAARAEALPFKDGAFDTVISALVLCSVDDQPGALAEIRRVLRPGGVLRLMEHVRLRGVLGSLQDLAHPAWKAFTGGCNLNRETGRAVEVAGFLVEERSLRERGMMLRLQARAP